MTHSSKKIHIGNLVLILFIVFCFSSCKKPDSDPGSSPGSSAFETEATVLTNSFLDNLEEDLLMAGYTEKQVDFITAYVHLQLIRDEADETSDLSILTPCIIKGAQLSLIETEVGLTTSDERLAVIEIIVASIISSLSGNVSSSTARNQSNQPLKSISTGPNYSTSVSYSNVLKQIVQTSIQYLDDAGIDSTEIIDAIKKVVRKVSANLTNAGVQSSERPTVAKSISTAAVGSLDEAGITSSDMSDAIKAVTSGTLTGLKEDGCNNETIASLSDEVTEGTILGLKEAGVSDSDIDSMVDVVKSSVNDGLDEAGLSTDEIDDVQTIIDEAANLGKRGLSLKSFLTFKFLSSTNSALTVDVTGTIDDENKTISLTVPYGTNVIALVASFTTTGDLVKIGETTQTSGSTANDYSNSVVFTIVDANGDTVEYTVSVSILAYDLTVFTNPADGATSVDRTGSISVTFSASMDTSTISTNTSDTSCSGSIQVSRDNFSTCIQMSAAPVASNDNKTFTVSPTLALLEETTHKIKTLKSARDTRGNIMTSDYVSSTGFVSGKRNWIQATSNAAFPARWLHASAVFDNKIWIIGGSDSIGTKLNDVWNSADGINWTQITANAGFTARGYLASLVFENKIWVIGGNDGALKNDVWSSSDGVSWTQATAGASFTARSGHSVLVFQNKMWIIAGDISGDNLNDVHYSTDGINWTQVTANAPFNKRGLHTSVVYDEKMWVMGGRTTSGSVNRNDVWYSSDGIIWNRTTDSAGFSVRTQHSSVVFNNRMWVIAGCELSSATYHNDVWSSDDGINWNQSNIDTVFSTRRSQTTAVLNDKIWIMGGYDGTNKLNDVWYSQ